MKLKLTVVDAREERDVVITTDVTATIADIAGCLRAEHSAVPDGSPPLTLRVEFPGRRQGRVLNAGRASERVEPALRMQGGGRDGGRTANGG